MYIVIIGWTYVALMMGVAEATNPAGTVVGGIFTFLLYGVGPVSLVVYLLGTPARKRAIRRREAAERDAAAAASHPPDGGRETPADPVAPVREEP